MFNGTQTQSETPDTDPQMKDAPDITNPAMPSPVKQGGLFRLGLTAFILAFSGAVTPGPMLALVIGQTLAQGVFAVIGILVGHALIEAVLVACIAKGLGDVLSRPRVRGGLGLLGGMALLWMGYDVLANAGCMSISHANGSSMPWHTLVFAGVGVSLSNPYFTGWWATIGTGQFATLGIKTRGQIAAFFLGHEMGDVAWFLFVAMLLVTGKRWLTDAVYHGLLYTCGSVILILGLLFVGLGINFLRRSERPLCTGLTPSTEA